MQVGTARCQGSHKTQSHARIFKPLAFANIHGAREHNRPTNNDLPQSTLAPTTHRHDVRVPSVIFKAHLFEGDRDLLAIWRRHQVQLERVRTDVELLDRPGACRGLVHLERALISPFQTGSLSLLAGAASKSSQQVMQCARLRCHLVWTLASGADGMSRCKNKAGSLASCAL